MSEHVLVGLYDSPFVRRVAFALVHHGLPFRREVQSVYRDFEAVLRVNPLGQAPGLILPDGRNLTESGSIIEFLDLSAPLDRRLLPAGDAAFSVLQIEAVAMGVASKAMALNFERNRRAAPLRDAAQIARTARQVASGLDWLTARCGQGWLVAERISRADLALKTTLDYVQAKLPEVLLDHAGSLTEWQSAMETQSPFSAVPFLLDE